MDCADGERVQMTLDRVEGRAGVGDGEKCRAPLQQQGAQSRYAEQRDERAEVEREHVLARRDVEAVSGPRVGCELGGGVDERDRARHRRVLVRAGQARSARGDVHRHRQRLASHQQQPARMVRSAASKPPGPLLARVGLVESEPHAARDGGSECVFRSKVITESGRK